MSDVLEKRVRGPTAELEAMNQELRESEARYQNLLHSVANYVYTVQLRRGQVGSTTHGPGCTTVTGYTPADYMADAYLWYRIIHEHDREAVTQVINRLLAGEVVQPLEHQIYHKDNSLRWIRHTFVPHFDHHGQLVAYDGLIEDITERKQAEEALQRNQAAVLQFSERLAVMQEITNQLSKAESFDELCRQAVELGRARLGFDRIGIWFVGERLGVAKGSFGTDEHGGLRDERGATVEFGPDQPDWHLLSRKESVVIALSKPLYDHFRRCVGEGERAIATLWDGDETLGLIAVDNLLTHQPITEQQLEILRLYATTLGHLFRRRQAEDELRTSEERYRALYRDNPSMFFTLNSNGIIISVNDFGASQLGYTKEQLEGQSVFKVFYEADRAAVIEQFNACLQNPWQVFYWQFRKVRLNGSILWVEEFARAVNGPGDTLNVLVVCNDVTERKAMEQALRLARDELEARVAQRTAELEKANKQLSALYQVAQTITAQLELDVTLGAIARSAANLLGTDTGAILLLNKTGETLSIKGAHGLSKAVVDETHDHVGESIAGRVVQTGQPIIANDLLNERRFCNPSAAQDGLLACASVPLVVGERIIGTLDVYSKTDRYAFTDTHIQILSLLASQAAIVIENARLYEAAQQEIIERKRVEATLQERNEQLKTLINAMPDIVVFKDAQGRYIETNDFNLRFFDLEGVDYRGKTDSELAELTPFYCDALKGCFKTDEVAWEAQSMSRNDESIPRPDGPPCIFDVIKVPTFDPNGSRKGLVVVGRDVTERKQMEEALRKAHAELEKRVEERTAALRRANDLLTQEIEERKRIEKGLRTTEAEKTLLLNTTLDLVVYHAKDMRILWANQVASDSVNMTADELVGRYCWEIWHQRQEPCEGCPVLLSRDTGQPQSAEISSPDGRNWFIRGHLLKDDNGQLIGMAEFCLDITKRKRAEEEIRQLNQELEQRVSERTAQLEAVNQELEAFSYSVSHDLRAPLRHIGGFVEMLRRSTEMVADEQSKHYMDIITDATQHMKTMIDDLLSFSRMSRSAMSSVQVDLGALVREVIQEFEIETKDREIEWQISPLPEVNGDRAMLRMVFENLIANTLKFTKSRAPAKIEVGWKPAPEDGNIIFIRDNGVGFDMKYADKLFGVFQRLHRSDEFEGTGIGLANVRRIVERHGGRTWAEGEVNHGAVFYFSLPTHG